MPKANYAQRFGARLAAPMWYFCALLSVPTLFVESAASFPNTAADILDAATEPTIGTAVRSRALLRSESEAGGSLVEQTSAAMEQQAPTKKAIGSAEECKSDRERLCGVGMTVKKLTSCLRGWAFENGLHTIQNRPCAELILKDIERLGGHLGHLGEGHKAFLKNKEAVKDSDMQQENEQIFAKWLERRKTHRDEDFVLKKLPEKEMHCCIGTHVLPGPLIKDVAQVQQCLAECLKEENKGECRFVSFSQQKNQCQLCKACEWCKDCATDIAVKTFESYELILAEKASVWPTLIDPEEDDKVAYVKDKIHMARKQRPAPEARDPKAAQSAEDAIQNEILDSEEKAAEGSKDVKDAEKDEKLLDEQVKELESELDDGAGKAVDDAVQNVVKAEAEDEAAASSDNCNTEKAAEVLKKLETCGLEKCLCLAVMWKSMADASCTARPVYANTLKQQREEEGGCEDTFKKMKVNEYVASKGGAAGVQGACSDECKTNLAKMGSGCSPLCEIKVEPWPKKCAWKSGASCGTCSKCTIEATETPQAKLCKTDCSGCYSCNQKDSGTGSNATVSAQAAKQSLGDMEDLSADDLKSEMDQLQEAAKQNPVVALRLARMTRLYREERGAEGAPMPDFGTGGRVAAMRLTAEYADVDGDGKLDQTEAKFIKDEMLGFTFVAHDKTCKGKALFAMEGKVQTEMKDLENFGACRNACVKSAACIYFYWRNHPGAENQFRCAGFATCEEGHRKALAVNDTGLLLKKGKHFIDVQKKEIEAQKATEEAEEDKIVGGATVLLMLILVCILLCGSRKQQPAKDPAPTPAAPAAPAETVEDADVAATAAPGAVSEEPVDEGQPGLEELVDEGQPGLEEPVDEGQPGLEEPVDEGQPGL